MINKMLQWLTAITLVMGLSIGLTGCGGGASGSEEDVTPSEFSFTAQMDRELNTLVESNAITVTGITSAVSITVTGGEYSINGGAFVSTEGTVSNGQSVVVRQNSPATYSTNQDVTLNVGGVSDTFTVTTLDDTFPDAFAFTAQIGIALNTRVESNVITVAGIEAAASIAIAGGEYSIDGGAFVSSEGTVNNGQTVLVRHTSSSDYSTLTNTTLTIGDVDSIFSLTTLDDTTPNAFTFIAQNEVAFNTIIESNAITVSDINADIGISITGGEYSINGGEFISTNGTVSNGQSIVVRLTSAGDYFTLTQTTLTIGGVNDTFSVTTIADTQAPTAFITFPPTLSLTESESIIVRGTASDNLSGVTAVYVNGEIANTTDGFQNWSLPVNLSSGKNTLTVSTLDAESNEDNSATQASIVVKGSELNEPAAITLDKTNNRVLLISVETNELLAIDLTSNSMTVLSDSSGSIDFNEPNGIALDIANNRALVADGDLNSITAVDLSTGERTAFAEDAETPMGDATSIVIDDTNNRALVIDSNESRIVAVNLDTQAISVLSDEDTANSIQIFINPSGIVLDSKHNRALVTDRDDEGYLVLLAVDLASGARTLISDNSSQGATSITHAWGVVLDSDSNRALAVSYYDDDSVAIVAIDITTGIQSVLSDEANAGSAISFDDPFGITLDKDNNRALLTDSELNVVIAMDLTTGVRTSFFSNETPNANHLFGDPERIIVDANNNRALVTDSNLGAKLAIDLNTGERTVLSSNQTADGFNKRSFPKAMTLDATNNRVLVTASLSDIEGLAVRAIIADNALIAIDLTTGHRTIISDNDTPDGGEVLDAPVGVTLDSNNNRVLILEGGRTAYGLVAVDLTTGIRSVFSNNTTPDDQNTFSKVSHVTLDSANNRALVTSSNIGILAVDLALGTRTILSDDATPPGGANELGTVNAIIVDAENNRALVVDSYLDAVLAVDLTTGARTILSDNSAPNDKNIFDDPTGLAIDTINNRLLVLDTTAQAIIAVDLENGQRVILSGWLQED